MGDLFELTKALQLAAQLEHCLLNSYINAACSLKSTPEEFEYTSKGVCVYPSPYSDSVRFYHSDIG